jgi:hypothetical protein
MAPSKKPDPANLCTVPYNEAKEKAHDAKAEQILQMLNANAKLLESAHRHRYDESLYAFCRRFATSESTAKKAFKKMVTHLDYRDKHVVHELAIMPAKKVWNNNAAQVLAAASTPDQCTSAGARAHASLPVCVLERSAMLTTHTRVAFSLSAMLQPHAASRHPGVGLQGTAGAVQAHRAAQPQPALQGGCRPRHHAAVQRMGHRATQLRHEPSRPVDGDRRRVGRLGPPLQLLPPVAPPSLLIPSQRDGRGASVAARVQASTVMSLKWIVYIQSMASHDAVHYPDRLDKLFMINCPSFVSSGYTTPPPALAARAHARNARRPLQARPQRPPPSATCFSRFHPAARRRAFPTVLLLCALTLRCRPPLS